jgi:anti-anti-sigma factor
VEAAHRIDGGPSPSVQTGIAARLRATVIVTAPPMLDIEVSLFDDEVVVRLFGEVASGTAPKLGAALESLLERGHRSLVLDLAQLLEFINGTGMQMIIDCAGRCAIMGGSLMVRSPSLKLRRLLAIAGAGSLIRVEHSGAASAHLGPEQPTGPSGSSMGTTTVAPAPTERPLMELPADREVVDSALRLVVALATATVGGADGVSVSLRRHGVLSTVAASDTTISEMDASQYATGEGPCVDASNRGRWFHAEALTSETRWPDFTPRARELGINAILSSPLLAQHTPVGALNIYSRTESAFSPADQELASVFAVQASNILTSAGVGVSSAEAATRFASALRGREIVAQAQGVLMERFRFDEATAFSTLLRSSVWTDETMHQLAEGIVRSALSLRPEASPLAGGGSSA